MGLKRISAGGPGFNESVFIAEEPIGKRCSVVITNIGQVANNPARVSMGTTALTLAGTGVTKAGALSGRPCRVVRNGVVSGVVMFGSVGTGDALCAASNTSGPGLASGSGGLIKATYTPAGTIGATTVMSGVFSGSFTGTSYSVGKVIAKALMSGGIGSAIPVMVIGVG